MAFCFNCGFPPLPLSERSVCLFAVFLAQQGLRPQTISSYLSALRHLQIAAGLDATSRSDWPRLQYVLKGIHRSQDASVRRRLPITANILLKLQEVWSRSQGCENAYMARLLWAACCLGYFGFLRSGEFTSTDSSAPPSILSSDVAVDSHSDPSVLRVRLRRAKTDPFGNGINIYMGKTGSSLCPITAILNFLAVRASVEGPLFVLSNGKPLSKSYFVNRVRAALHVAGIDEKAYSGHSFRIGAATAAAAAGVPAYLIKMLGRWESEAYQLYIRTPRETLASISQAIAH